MRSALGGVIADTELGGGNALMGESHYTNARQFARYLVPEDLVAELMEKIFTEGRAEAADALRVAILTTAERLGSRRYFDAKALDNLWIEVRPTNGWGAGRYRICRLEGLAQRTR